MVKFFEEYKKCLITQYPTAGGLLDLSSRLEYLISDIIVGLPKSVLSRAEAAIKKITEYAHSKNRIDLFRKNLSISDAKILDAYPHIRNASVLMAYDFHYDATADQISLIEINTNGAAFLLSDLLYQADPATGATNWPHAIESLKSSFKNELELMNSKKSPRIQIMDEAPTEQKLYFEFLMFQDLFKSWGWPAEISDPKKTIKSIEAREVDFIYNRYTDFKFTNESSRPLLTAYLNGQLIFSPNPREYLLLAEKNNLIEFSKNKVSEVVIPAFDLQHHPDPDLVWSDRKKYVFKPKSSYGSKGVFKGSSISRKTFLEILKQDFIAQEYRPPGEMGPWKYDLRFFVYQDEIQLGVARLYQGQVTNSRTRGGGFARLSFE